REVEHANAGKWAIHRFLFLFVARFRNTDEQMTQMYAPSPSPYSSILDSVSEGLSGPPEGRSFGGAKLRPSGGLPLSWLTCQAHSHWHQMKNGNLRRKRPN